MAYPGLWKTTVQVVSQTEVQPEVHWHCVDEAEDPWQAYAQLNFVDASCVQTKSERTGTSLEWTVECKSPLTVVNTGRIVFDSPSHYRGTVEMTGTFMSYPIQEKIIVEGERHAACTSPSD